jgi:hypothetical protein
MLKMVTFFQGFPGQQSVPGTLNFAVSPQKPRSTSEAESETSMSEASSEDLMPSPEAPDGEEESAKKKEKKSKGLANMFSVFTKGKKKKKDQPRLSDLEVQPKPRPELDGPLPTGRLWPQLGLERKEGVGPGLGSVGGLISQDSQASHQSGRGGSLLRS